jgi:hypothetical protein
MIAKYFAMSLAMENVVSAPWVISSLDLGHPVDRALDTGVAPAGGNAVHVVAQVAVCHREGHDQVDHQADGEDQADEVDGGHSRSTPLTTRPSSANSSIVSSTNTRSGTVQVLLDRFWFPNRQFPAENLVEVSGDGGRAAHQSLL